MRRCILFATIGVFIFGVGLAWAQKPTGKPRQPTPVISLQRLGPQGQIAPLAVSVYTVSPVGVGFSASNPPNSVTGLPDPTTVSFKTTANPTFSVYAKALAANFSCTNGTNPPVNSVTLTCSGASGAAVCQSGALTLTNTGNGVKVAGGHGNGTNGLTLTYAFQDSLTYSRNTSCTLNVSFVYTEP